MRIWWLCDFERLERERRAIEELSQAEPWLQDARWVLEQTDLCVDATIEAGGVQYRVRLRYPPFFPATPPAVWPQDREAPRWSAHQYGAGGELCLEWGPDNWHPEVTGAEVLRSAYRLLSTENPLGEGETVEVRSRHRTTLGQNLRSSFYRLVVTETAAAHLSGLEGEAEAELQVLFHPGSLVAVMRSVESDGKKWTDPNVPRALAHVDWSWRALVLRKSVPVSAVRPQSLAELKEEVAAAGFDPARLDAVDGSGRHRLDGVLLADDTAGVALIRIINRAKGQVARCETVIAHTGQEGSRLGAGASTLREKRVGVVGLGSAGSKIALMLVRSGVRKFVLVDDDLFLPENLVRHTLDWRSVGEHKVDGVAFQLELVAPDVEVAVERRQLTGQESTSSVAAALANLAACDLVVDATACGRTFGLLGTMASQSETALVWLEIFEGGIGGLVGRYRPGKDPEPFVIRGRVLSYLAEQRAPELKSAGPYTAEGPGQEPLVASDADVTAISSHAARFVLDALAQREPSEFPQSVYLVGLSREWLFKAPFNTQPIDVGKAEARGENREGAPPSRETTEFILEVVERGAGGRDSSSS